MQAKQVITLPGITKNEIIRIGHGSKRLTLAAITPLQLGKNLGKVSAVLIV
jgi:hypothetical protein